MSGASQRPPLADPRASLPGGEGTLSFTAEAGGAGGAARSAHLFLALDGHRLLSPPARISLAGLDGIAIGRGAERRIEPAGPRRLSVRVDDPWMSSAHARITRVPGRWLLEDTGSKNGSLVNGAPTAHAELVDGDVIEIGRIFFVFRDGLPDLPGDPPVLDAASFRPPIPGLVTLLPALAGLFAKVAAIARSEVPVLIEGETGTGKEVAARAIHAASGRAGAFVAVNCGALPASLLEGELFGHKKGAFSGATEDRPGLVRSADRGTLFLDELGDLPLSSQAALLRVLQEREVVPVGAARPVPVDFRVIAATHRPIDRLVAAGGLRADLFNRVAGHRIELPPLRRRREDLGLILGAILARRAPERAASVRLHPRAARALIGHQWPGNVRELERAIEAALALAGRDAIDLEHLPPALHSPSVADSIHPASGPPSESAPAPAAEDATRREQLVALLREHRGNVSAVARAMGKARMQVQRWFKRYGLDPEGFRR